MRIRDRFRHLAGLTLAASLALVRPAAAGTDWMPPRPVQVLAPSASLVPGQQVTLSFMIRAQGVPANLSWEATTDGGTFMPNVTPMLGTVSVAANQTVTVPLTVSVPSNVSGSAIGFVDIKVTYNNPGMGWAINPEATMTIRASTSGRPEMIPVISSWSSPAGTLYNVSYQLRSVVGISENYSLTVTRNNPDPNNTGMIFPGTHPTSPITLPAGATVTIPVSQRIQGNALPGNFNSIRLLASSTTTSGRTADATGFAVVSTAHPDSFPTAFAPGGLTRFQPTLGAAFSGRDGPTPVPGLGLIATPANWHGIQVLRDSVLDQVGTLDLDNNGSDDRLVGRVRTPAKAAALAIIPGLINSASEVMDVGLLACGTTGLMLVHLRELVDPPIGSWEDWYDWDGNGIDDRILRMIPLPGFATDVEWFRTPENRYVALVALADTGSSPVSASYDPLLTTPGSGAGIIAIDVNAALDSLPGVPFIAGALETPGTTLDLALRGGPQPDLAVADGGDSVTFWRVLATGSPATVGFERGDAIALSSVWGPPLARDLDWLVDNPTSDSTWLAAATGLGGLQIIKAPRPGTPFLALVQRTPSSAIGVATTIWGHVATAMGTAGAALYRLPKNEVLALLDPAASPPYQTPVLLDQASPWPGSTPLQVGVHGTIQTAITSLRFARPITMATIPMLMCSDNMRMTTLKAGSLQSLLDVPEPTITWTPGLQLLVAPNPLRGATAELRVLADLAFRGPEAGEPPLFEILDVQGRVLRKLRGSHGGAASGLLARAVFDGRDDSGRALNPGQYWVRASQRGGWTARTGFTVLR